MTIPGGVLAGDSDHNRERRESGAATISGRNEHRTLSPRALGLAYRGLLAAAPQRDGEQIIRKMKDLSNALEVVSTADAACVCLPDPAT